MNKIYYSEKWKNDKKCGESFFHYIIDGKFGFFRKTTLMRYGNTIDPTDLENLRLILKYE